MGSPAARRIPSGSLSPALRIRLQGYPRPDPQSGRGYPCRRIFEGKGVLYERAADRGVVAERPQHAEGGRRSAGDALAEHQQVAILRKEPADRLSALEEERRLRHRIPLPGVAARAPVDVQAGDSGGMHEPGVDEDGGETGQLHHGPGDRRRRRAPRRGVRPGRHARYRAGRDQFRVQDRREESLFRCRPGTRYAGDGGEHGVREDQRHHRAARPETGVF